MVLLVFWTYVFLELFSLTKIAVEAKSCYSMNNNHTQWADGSYLICRPNDLDSACCSKDDLCTSTGICLAFGIGYEDRFFVNGCTDPTGTSDKCPELCQSVALGNATGYELRECGDGTFCCSASPNATSCCHDSDRIQHDPRGALLYPQTGDVINPMFNYSLSSTVSGNVSSSTSSSGTTGIDEQHRACPKDNTAVVGGALGGILGAVLIAAIITVVLLLRTRQRNSTSYTSMKQAKLSSNSLTIEERLAELEKQLQQRQAIAKTSHTTGVYEIDGDHGYAHMLDGVAAIRHELGLQEPHTDGAHR